MAPNRDRDRVHAPFSRPLAVADVPEDGMEISISANAEERAALAKADGLCGLPRLEADFKVERKGAGRFELTGEVRARVRQACVVTLEEFETDVVEPIEARFAPCASADEAQGRSRKTKDRRRAPRAETARTRVGHVGLADDDPPDPLLGDKIDLGALAAEFLVLGLDPYPRKPGATFAEREPPQENEAVSPFAALRSRAEKK